jgi:hypothetical protein
VSGRVKLVRQGGCGLRSGKESEMGPEVDREAQGDWRGSSERVCDKGPNKKKTQHFGKKNKSHWILQNIRGRRSLYQKNYSEPGMRHDTQGNLFRCFAKPQRNQLLTGLSTKYLSTNQETRRYGCRVA